MSKSRTKKQCELLKLSCDENYKYNIYIDEVGRGPLIGKVFCGAVVLPNIVEFDISDIKDSKKFSSKKKMKEVCEHIKQNVLLWKVESVDEKIIDDINILQAVYRGMHECVRNIIQELIIIEKSNNNTLDLQKDILLVVDGNRFKPYMVFDETSQSMIEIPHVTIEKGDSIYVGIASAAIIAKVTHDEYILDLCKDYPLLATNYDIHNNYGYGTKNHLEGIRTHGITQFHRKTFGICKTSQLCEL